MYLFLQELVIFKTNCIHAQHHLYPAINGLDYRNPLRSPALKIKSKSAGSAGTPPTKVAGNLWSVMAKDRTTWHTLKVTYVHQ